MPSSPSATRTLVASAESLWLLTSAQEPDENGRGRCEGLELDIALRDVNDVGESPALANRRPTPVSDSSQPGAPAARINDASPSVGDLRRHPRRPCTPTPGCISGLARDSTRSSSKARRCDQEPSFLARAIYESSRPAGSARADTGAI
ncbi:hypothetical protein BD311DRAFT_810645 [Dichomitus squalens]|uniref:Uncharacterized protein n=1 Tax=Dichomitus squalens TaxID=114155 RepID=A0A4Q9M8X7_9APHY|nr:hypothetical protein BD311DRAFT_810645 [Dichomitus squalens]